MRARIGDLLESMGLITGLQLTTALRAQLVHGGHLGTCLMELGMIDEDSLGDALAQVAGVPYAPAFTLREITLATIKALPHVLAEKHQAVPIKIHDGTLLVSMIDPRNEIGRASCRERG